MLQLDATPLLTICDVYKAFSTITVLRKISFTLLRGEVHALLGGNGAGKSTLMKIIAGLYLPDSGTIEVNGQQVAGLTPIKAHQLGIYLVPQEPMLFPSLSVEENILFRLPQTQHNKNRLSWLIEELGVDIDLLAAGGTLNIADQQLVEIMRGLMRDTRILILDEPTASLTPIETERFFKQLRILQSRGVGIIFISHKLPEIRQIADRISVMCDGEIMLSDIPEQLSTQTIIQALTPQQQGLGTGSAEKPINKLFQQRFTHENVGLKVTQLSGEGFSSISFFLKPGEIVGLSGVVGSGRTELAETIYGLRPVNSGEILLGERRLTLLKTAERLTAGLVYLPEDRQVSGLYMDVLPSWNITTLCCNGFFTQPSRDHQLFEHYRQVLDIKLQDERQLTRILSGGNQQKVLLAKCLAAKPTVLLIDEPTRGVDVNTRNEIYQLIKQIAQQQVAVLLISSDPAEIVQVSNRVLVMHQGELCGELTDSDINVEKIMQLSFDGSFRSSHGEVVCC